MNIEWDCELATIGSRSFELPKPAGLFNPPFKAGCSGYAEEHRQNEEECSYYRNHTGRGNANLWMGDTQPEP
jgi:hypothetical protein